ncbi:AMP-binding protein [Micropruina sonneratiae]|uniref:AMP-binding protein n=1 Tax=Micropruina sonneratiae TaxID=2986940 RepID=UPI002227826F|nr:AMP-binding protein [Micropruina sp. KQZ13P-5]MCW3156643.1 AMP-binding protein [Micropruina sp. KQZ13P-5]
MPSPEALVVPNVTVYDSLFADLTEADADRVAMVNGANGVEVTFGQLRERVDAFAGWLAVQGIGPGDVVGLLAPNGAAFAIAFHGILAAGATATTINALYTPAQITNQLRDASAVAVVTVSQLLPGVEVAAAELGIPAGRVVVIDGAEGHPSASEILAAGHPRPELDLDPATRLAVLPYSSGTTGYPKGVMLTHRNLVANVAQCQPIGVTGDDVVLAVLPFFHIYGMTVLLNYALQRRARLVTMARFDLAEFLRIIERHRTTWVFIAPPIAVALAKHPAVDAVDTSAVKVVFSGAAPLDAALADAVAKRLGCVVAQGYGMTETSPVTHVIDWRDASIDRSSIGTPVPGTQARVVDADGNDVAVPPEGPSERGELWIRGPQVMTGYLNDPEATAATLDADGWLHTGDLATVDALGIYRIVDRLKELIKYRGYQVPPAVLESVLLQHPDVADAAAVGALDDDGQEFPKAFVVRRPGSEVSAEDVMAFVAERVAPHEKVRAVEFIEAVPKSASGKILRRELKDAHGA